MCKTQRRTGGGIVGAALLCGLVFTAPAFAQEGGGERHIIIDTPEGRREFHLGAGDATLGPDGGQVIAIRINGNGANFSFIGSPSDLPFGDNLGPMGIAAMANGANGSLNIIDPGFSYTYLLLKRPDVRSDIFLNSKQRDQLDELENAENLANQARMDAFQGVVKGEHGAAPGKGADPQSGAAADRAKTLHELMQGSATERDKKLAAILTEKQIRRLKELDLQYRGPLAMGVKPVADKTKLTDHEAPVVADLLKEYRNTVRKALGMDQTVTRSQSPDGSSSVNINTNYTASSPEEMKARLEKAHDEIEKSRKLLGDKALNGVTEAQRAEWKNLTGTKFQFQFQSQTLN